MSTALSACLSTSCPEFRLTSHTITQFNPLPAVGVFAGFVLDTDGVFYEERNVTDSAVSAEYMTGSPAHSSFTTDAQARVTVVTGASPTTGAVGTWVSLSVLRRWGIENTVHGTNVIGDWTLEIGRNSIAFVSANVQIQSQLG
jgi:hypothetical protein